MIDRVNQDAWKIRKLMREVEALNDEMLIALSQLKSEMIKARQNPIVAVRTGQTAILHLTEAEQLTTRASNQIFKTHGALNEVALTTAGLDTDIPTVFEGAAKAEPAIAKAPDAVLEQSNN